MASTKIITDTPGVIRLQQGITRKVKPAQSGGFKEIPIIDVSGMYSDHLADRIKVAGAVRDACTRVGFMQIRNHGIDWKIVETAFEGAKRFFDLPMEKKMEVYQHKNRHFHGYEPLYETNLNKLKRGDCKEAFSWGYTPEDDPQKVPNMPDLLIRTSIWPDEETLSGFRGQMVPYQQALITFSRKFIRIFALALHLPEDYFDKKVTYPMAGVRSLHYPPMTGSDDEETGLGAHTDIEFFTIIAQTPSKYPALKVLNAEGEWVSVVPSSECFVVNIADMMMRMTNDTFLSTVHRVENKGDIDRYSLPFFFGVNADELIEVLPTTITDENQKKYEPMTTLEV
ncbi:MAG: hypothetical protein M1834_000471 [Cirrosporium novae-zelandiae]|nr:MAG: hypothetical protein M1834_000471 [Cirrosporium novae-zelandiae]